MRDCFTRIKHLGVFMKRTQALLFGAVLVVFVFLAGRVQAADFTTRSVTIDSPIAGERTKHTFEMRSSTAGPIGSILFEYCSNSPLVETACATPVGLNVDNVSLDGQSGITGFSVNGAGTTANRIVISRTPSATTPVDLTYVFSNVINPSAVNQTVYVRIASYATANATGPLTDRGAVVFSTTSGIGVGGFVPPYLTFCVGVTVNFGCNGGGQGFLESFGELSPGAPATATTQFGAATNDPTGYNVFMNGQTLTSGNQTINPLPQERVSSPGTPQFGINLVNNSSPSVGSNVIGPGGASATADYSRRNQFRFVNGERIASAPLPVAFNAFTVSYLVNISEDQAPGIYSSTLTYTAIASF